MKEWKLKQEVYHRLNPTHKDTLNDKEKLEQLDKALSKLNKIIDRYPSSDLAVKLISGQSIGNINLETVAESVISVAKSIKEVEYKAKKYACYEAHTTHCILVICLFRSMSSSKMIRSSLLLL